MPKPYASVIIKLLQTHALYSDDDPQYWQHLQDHEVAVRAYFEQIGVSLDLNRTDGYARLTQPAPVEDDPTPPLRLLRRVGLSYEQSLLCVVLREWLEEHEASAQTTTRRLFATRVEIRERVELFFHQPTNRKAWLSKLDIVIEKLETHGLLKVNRRDDAQPDQTQYEIKALLKAKISLEKLEEFKEKLQRHAESV
ncbi:DUF4194 domain-containing protein [Hymenobacter baengnokdamensis]|uniref:DUF4194 domain-containing protein n=1 Tax=Hymenobacter baengnokdamensis TaxID=2615203 RepID=UPI001243E7EF|nr:DUF4194 domain-containing protein [Hymenobacter baengnokdamensis]